MTPPNKTTKTDTTIEKLREEYMGLMNNLARGVHDDKTAGEALDSIWSWILQHFTPVAEVQQKQSNVAETQESATTDPKTDWEKEAIEILQEAVQEFVVDCSQGGEVASIKIRKWSRLTDFIRQELSHQREELLDRVEREVTWAIRSIDNSEMGSLDDVRDEAVFVTENTLSALREKEDRTRLKCAVLIGVKEKVHQVALDDRQIDSLLSFLPQLFDDHKIKVVVGELHGVKFATDLPITPKKK